MSGATNTRFSVALHALAFLGSAGIGRAVSSDELAESVETNPVHVRRVLGPLREAGVVRSRPGAQGGWELCRQPEDLQLGEVWDLLRGDRAVLGVHDPSSDCPVGQGVRTAITALEGGVSDAVRGHLAEVTLADFLADAGLATGLTPPLPGAAAFGGGAALRR